MREGEEAGSRRRNPTAVNEETRLQSRILGATYGSATYSSRLSSGNSARL